MRSDYLNPKIYEELYAVMQRANVNALRVTLETGLRIDDVLSIKPSDIQGQKLTYTAKKTGKKGKATLSKNLCNELLAEASEEWVFPSKKEGKHRTRQAVYKDIKKACRLLGVEGQISPHSARKTFAVELRKDKGLAEVQKQLQHTDKETTLIYAFADISQGGIDKRTEAEAELIAELVAEKIKRLFENGGNS